MNAAAALLIAALNDGPARAWGGKTTASGWVVPSYLQTRILEAADEETPRIVVDVANRRPRALQDVNDGQVRRMVRGTLISVREASEIRSTLESKAKNEPEPAPEDDDEDEPARSPQASPA